MAITHIPRWLERYDEKTQQNILLIISRYYAIIHLLENNSGGGDLADIKAAKINLRDALSNDMTRDELWSAVMLIRPQVLNGRFPVSFAEEIEQALLAEKNYGIVADPSFFDKLAGQINKHQVGFFRAVIAGGAFSAKDSKGVERAHYFPGIPLHIRREAGVQLTTKPDNLQMVAAAYRVMAQETAGHARTALEAIIADIKELSRNLI